MLLTHTRVSPKIRGMSPLPSKLIPQADALPDIVGVTKAVSAGATTYQQIAKAIGKVERQGRYYRLAAEQLGLLLPTSVNHSALSTLGRELTRAGSDTQRREILVRGMMQNPVLNGILNFIADAGSAGRSRDDLEQWLSSNTTATGATPGRRVATIRSWLASMQLVTPNGYPVRLLKQNDPIERLAPEEANSNSSIIPKYPLVPFNGQRLPPQHIPSKVIQYDVDRAKLERATAIHERMVAEVAKKAKEARFASRRNKFIDLFSFRKKNSVLFEFKTNSQRNCGTQVRRAVSQLYEYQWRQRLDSSKLVVVLQNEPIQDNFWIVDYLVRSRTILPIWRVGSDAYDGPKASARALRWLIEP